MASRITCNSIVIILATIQIVAFSGCASFRRHNSVKEEKPAAPQTTSTAPTAPTTAPAPTPSPLAVPSPEEVAARAFAQALTLFENGKFDQAKEKFNGFLVDYPTNQQCNDARYYLGIIAYRAGNKTEALNYLKDVVFASKDRALKGETMLMLGEGYFENNQLPEAMAITHELLPQEKIDEKLGLPQNTPWKMKRDFAPLYTHRVEAYLLRAKIFAKRGDFNSADRAVKQGRRLLDTTTGYGIPEAKAKELKAVSAWQQLQILKIQCEPLTKLEKISEDELLQSSEKYYECIKPAPGLICEIHRNDPKASYKEQSHQTYKDLAWGLKNLENPLPPPATPFKDPQQQPFFEQEMRDLIDKIIKNHSEDLRSIEECGLVGIF